MIRSNLAFSVLGIFFAAVHVAISCVATNLEVLIERFDECEDLDNSYYAVGGLHDMMLSGNGA